MPLAKRRPNIKLQRLAEELVKTGNGAQAAQNAGYQVANRDNGSGLVSEYLGKPQFREMVKTALENVNATREVAVSVIVQRMTDQNPRNAAVSLRAAEIVLKLWDRVEGNPKEDKGEERTHDLFKEPIEIRRWFLLSGRMPTADERVILSQMKSGETVDPELLQRLLTGKK